MWLDTAWNGNADTPITPINSDRWGSYRFERDLMSDYAAGAGVDMFIVHSDSHALQADDGTGNNAAGVSEKNGFAVVCAGPMGRDSHAAFPEYYTYTWPTDSGDNVSNQYMRLVFHQTDSTHVQVTAIPWDCTKNRRGTPMNPFPSLVKTYTVNPH